MIRETLYTAPKDINCFDINDKFCIVVYVCRDERENQISGHINISPALPAVENLFKKELGEVDTKGYDSEILIMDIVNTIDRSL